MRKITHLFAALYSSTQLPVTYIYSVSMASFAFFSKTGGRILFKLSGDVACILLCRSAEPGLFTQPSFFFLQLDFGTSYLLM